MNFNCKEQLSGVAELEVYLLTEVSNWPLVLTDANAGQLVFNPFPKSVDATIVPDSIQLRYPKRQKTNGLVFSIDISMDFNTRSESLEQYLDQYQNQPCIVLAKLNNQFQKIFGTNLQPLYLVYQVNDDTKIDGAAVTSIEIKGETSQRPVYYTV